MSGGQDSDERPYIDSDHDDDDESQDSSYDEATDNGLFDLEASEDASAAAYEARNGNDHDDDYFLEPFPQFMKFPAELREMVWKAFCPDLTAGPRLLEIFEKDSKSFDPALIPGPSLESQTAPMRTLLAVNRESRGMGLKLSPHTFSLSAGELIRYHGEKDVIHVVTPPRGEGAIFELAIQELGPSLQNVAFSFDNPGYALVDACYMLPGVRRLFILIDQVDLQDVKDYAWTVSENVHHYHFKTQEDGEAGLVTTIERMVCWPDLDKHRDFAQQSIDLRNAGSSTLKATVELYRNILADPRMNSKERLWLPMTKALLTESVSRLQKIEVWPMIQFTDDDGLQHFNDMKAWGRPWDEWEDSGPSGSDDTEDEYDSEGIDDDSIHDHLSTDDEDDLPGQLLADNSSDQSTLGQLLSSFSEVNDHLAAQFSSDDDDENENQASQAGASGLEEGEGFQSRASWPRRRVVESDSEDESVTETEEPRPAASRRGHAVLAESEDASDEEEGVDGPRPAPGRNRRARAVPSDSEDEDDDIPQPSRTTQNRRARAIPAESDDDDDEGDYREAVADPQNASSSTEDSSEGSSEDRDDEPAPPKRVSLAQRLRMEAQRARSGHLGDEDSEAEGNDRSATFDDDEEDRDDMAQAYSSEDGESEEEF